jgi:membrane-bound inhibitor of C-type lysozyme
MKIEKIISIVAISILAFVAGFYLGKYVEKSTYVPAMISAPEKTITAEFFCDKDQTISAIFKTRSVSLVLSDGRKVDLPQAISGSGARYANADESFVFWNKGDTAFIQEGELYTFENCATK